MEKKETTHKQEADSRTREELIRQIGQLAESYTPEWKFDPNCPDAGTALALIYADQFLETIRRYNLIPKKHRLAFFSQLGQKQLPSVPASGYVTFELSSDEFGGAQIPKGSIVSGSSKNSGSDEISYETTGALYVTPSRIKQMLLLDGTNDYIGKKDWNKPFLPFVPEEKNIQKHVLYLCQNEVLDIAGCAEVRLSLKSAGAQRQDLEMAWMLDETEFSIAYAAESGFEEFKSRRLDLGNLILKRGKEQPKPVKQEFWGREGFWVCCRYLKAWKREAFCVEDIRLASQADGIEPDLIQNEMGEQQNMAFLPFGESPAIFGECYLASAQAMGKPGAKIKLTFSLDYEKIPLDNSHPMQREWKLLMKRSNFESDPEYDITIEQVIWEYYNGLGWSRLNFETECQNIFHGGDGTPGQQITLVFTCPSDISLLEWQSAPTRYLRIRILRMNNLFKQKGAYITPIISNVRFQYSYAGSGRHPEFAAVQNQLEQTVFPVKALEPGPVKWNIFYGLNEKRRVLCLGFHQPLLEGPIRLFWSMEENIREELPHLALEYYGKKGFTPLTFVDETQNLQKSGCFTLMGKKDFEPFTICQETAYWIRIIDETDGYRRLQTSRAEFPPVQMPRINGIYPNTTKILAARNRLPEFFEVEPKEENKICRLLGDNIHTLEVWVNELTTITPLEREAMKAEHRLKEAWNTEGTLTGLWVRWDETEDFGHSGPKDRHYTLDKNQGTVTFSNGKQGAIPSFGDGETIEIHYSCGGGEAANLPQGAIDRLGASYGYVSSVTNHKAICGGYDQETITRALQRGGAALRHRGRAVTAGDYEALAYEASRFVQKVKCCPNYNGRGEYEPGSITLVLLLKEYQDGKILFDGIREEVTDYLACRMGGNQAELGHLYVVEPRFLEMDCEIKATAEDFNDIFEVQKCMEERLKAFLHPVTGNYDKIGWDIGVIPNETQITNALRDIPGLVCINQLRMAAFFRTTQGRMEIQPQNQGFKQTAAHASVSATRFAVGLSGINSITVTAE